VGRGGFWAGVAAGPAFVVVELLGRAVAGVPTLPELVEGRLVQAVPGAAFSFLLDRLYYLGKPVLFGGLLLVQLALAGLAGVAVARGVRPWPLAAALWLFSGVGLLPAAGLGVFAGSAGEALATLCAFAALAWGLDGFGGRVRAPAGGPSEGGAAGPRFDAGRRRLIGALAGSVASLLLARRIIGRLPALPGLGGAPAQPGPGGLAAGATAGASGAASSFAGMPAAITPADRFYVVSKNLVDPVVAADGWKLEVAGLVDHPLTLRYEDVLALPAVEAVRTLECISNPVGGPLISNGRFTGVRLADLLRRAGVRPEAELLHFAAVDGYTENMALQDALDPTTLLVYRLDGQPLPPKHGFPLRVLRIGRYGMKNPKWLTRIEAARSAPAGFWEQQGWSDRAVVQTMSRIDLPRDGARVPAGTVAVGGVAFAGARGIRRVEVSTDRGATWQAAKLLPAPGRYTWVLWEYSWRVERSGPYVVAVRATDGEGAVQPSHAANSFPNGATGYHRIVVLVV
jgi:hypothetical protein